MSYIPSAVRGHWYRYIVLQVFRLLYHIFRASEDAIADGKMIATSDELWMLNRARVDRGKAGQKARHQLAVAHIGGPEACAQLALF